MKKNKNYVKATSDIFIKYLFGLNSPESNNLALSFINSVLENSNFPAMTKVIQKNPFNYQEYADDKLSILDVEVEDENHKLYNIEVQSTGNTHFRNRALYYWAKLYTSQFGLGDLYEYLLPAIGINILDFTLFPDLTGFHNYFLLTEGREREYVLTDQLVIHFLEISKVKDVNFSSKLERWLLYLKIEGTDNEMLKILLETDKDLQAAHELYTAFNSNDKLRRYALAREKTEHDRLHFLSMARKEGLQEGLVKGIEKGIEKGELGDKHNVLVRLLQIKFGLKEEERELILSVTDFKKLDAALDGVVTVNDKESVLDILK